MTTDESDSHAVAFGRKRDHHEVSNNNDEHLDSIILTPRKRTKVEEADYEGGKSPGLSADDAATMAAEPVSPGYNEDARDQAMSEEEQDGATYALRKDSGPAPSANWNTGSKAKIRTSLGRGTEKDSGAQPYSEPDGTEHDQLLDENVPHKMTGTSAQSLVTGSPTQIVERRFDPPAAEKAVINLSDPMGELGNARTLNISTAENASARPEPPPKTHPDVDLESGDDVIILNVQNSGQESGEISEGHVQGSDADGGSQYRSEGAGSNSDSESDDAMISYSQSAPPDKDLNNAESPSQQRFAQSLSPRTMADLAPEELKLQLKYFHPTKTLDDLDGNGVFKCLVCAQEGHLPEACDKLTCAVCGKYNEHSTRTCPQRTRCKRCREPGHESSSCHHKLAATRAEIICDWCQRVGHIEDDCELLWRTSGRPWETQFIIRTLGLGCYECGQAGHLGNDCPSRRPGKPMGTSTWSLPGKHNQTSNSPDGIMIKGRAQQQRAIEVVDSEDDDKANFYRPRIPAPARRGQIRIASQGLGQHRSSSGTPLSALYQGDHAGGYRDSEYLGGRRGEYSSAREQDQYNYRPSGRRSASPHPSARGPNRISGRYKPLPQEQPPRHGTYGGEPYRPMPSAAHSAWTRHRT